MEVTISPIWEFLKRRRTELGMTQHSVANLAGITQSHLSALELGKLDTRLSTLQDIARALRSDLVIVPTEALSTVQSIIGQEPSPSERRLFRVEPD